MCVFAWIYAERYFWDGITDVFFFSLPEVRSAGIFRLTLLRITIHSDLSWCRPQSSLNLVYIQSSYMLELRGFVLFYKLIVDIFDS